MADPPYPAGTVVLRLVGQPAAALIQQNTLARGREMTGECAAVPPGADDDVVMVSHWLLLPSVVLRGADLRRLGRHGEQA